MEQYITRIAKNITGGGNAAGPASGGITIETTLETNTETSLPIPSPTKMQRSPTGAMITTRDRYVPY